MQNEAPCTMALSFEKNKMTIVKQWEGGFSLFLHHMIGIKPSKNFKPKLKIICSADFQRSLKTKKFFCVLDEEYI